jgi:hypothetical protein
MNDLRSAPDREKAARQHFYEIVEENKKMEFINGEIAFHSPVKRGYNKATGNVYEILRTYVRRQNLGRVGIEKLLISLSRNDYEPDLCFWTTEKESLFTDEQMQFPAPDFIAEVLSLSTDKNDRGIKFGPVKSVTPTGFSPLAIRSFFLSPRFPSHNPAPRGRFGVCRTRTTRPGPARGPGYARPAAAMPGSLPDCPSMKR